MSKKSNWLTRWLLGWVLNGVFWDSPQLPWSLGTFDKDSLLKDPHTYPLARLLEIGSPLLYMNLFWHVRPLAHAVTQKEREIKAFQPEIEHLAEEVGALEEEVNNQPHVNPNPENDFSPPSQPSMPDKPSEPRVEAWEIGLTVGLSLMLFLGIAAVLGIEVQAITLDQTPMLLFAITGAVCINIAEFQGIYRFVASYYRFEPRRSHCDDERYANQIPFWHHIRSGNPAVWMSFAIVLLETLFAFLGLISQLPPRLQESPGFQLTAFAAAALAATVNLVIAWGNALSAVQWQQDIEEWKFTCYQIKDNYHQAIEDYRQTREARLQDEAYSQRQKEYLQKEEEIIRERQNLCKQLGAVQRKLQEKQKDLANQERALMELKFKAVQEYERWELAVRRWIKENPAKVDNFIKLYPQWSNADRLSSDNGHGVYESVVSAHENENLINDSVL